MIPAAGHVAGFAVSKRHAAALRVTRQSPRRGAIARNDPSMEYLQADRPLWRTSAKIVGEHFGEATARGLGSIFR